LPDLFQIESLTVPDALDEQFIKEVEKMEGETMSSYITGFERRAMEKGREEGEQKLILKLLHKRFGSMPSEVEDSVKKLDLDGLESLAEAIFDFANIDDVLSWFKK
jgi:hypothetical protein